MRMYVLGEFEFILISYLLTWSFFLRTLNSSPVQMDLVPGAFIWVGFPAASLQPHKQTTLLWEQP